MNNIKDEVNEVAEVTSLGDTGKDTDRFHRIRIERPENIAKTERYDIQNSLFEIVLVVGKS